MEKIIFTNSKGQSVTLGNDGPFILTKIEGTGAVNTNIQSQKSPYQDGESYISNTLEARTISIEIMIIAETENEISRYRHKLLQIFNPKLGPGELRYQIGEKERKIQAISELAPTFPYVKDFYDTMQPGLIQLYCPAPFWEDIEEMRKDIALWVGDFSFPLEIKEQGIMLGHREPSLIVNVFNSGDVACGMRLEFKALGELTNPSLFNINTREFIKINKTMQSGEVIIITTHFANKKVELIKSDGTKENAFNYIDIDSTFIQLEVGDNLFRYNAETNIDNLEVSIYYTPQYLGV